VSGRFRRDMRRANLALALVLAAAIFTLLG
jgi:hypothetical protein